MGSGVGGLRLASRPSTHEGIAPAPPKRPGEGTGPKACLGVSEHLAAPSGCWSHSQAPNPQPWVHRWCLDATQTHWRPSGVNRLGSARGPLPQAPRASPGPTRTGNGARVGQHSGAVPRASRGPQGGQAGQPRGPGRRGVHVPHGAGSGLQGPVGAAVRPFSAAGKS